MKHTFSLLAKGLLCFLASVTAASMTAAGTASAPGLSATTEETGTATNLPEDGKTYYFGSNGHLVRYSLTALPISSQPRMAITPSGATGCIGNFCIASMLFSFMLIPLLQ